MTHTNLEQIAVESVATDDSSRATRKKTPSAVICALIGLLATLTISLSGWALLSWRQESVEQLHSQCRRLSAQQEWTALGRVAAQWSAREPQKADPWLYLAAADEGLKDWPKVIQHLEHVPRSDKRAVAALVRKSSIEFETLDRPWDGVHTCDEVLRLDPRVLIAHKQSIFFFAMTLQRAEMVRRIRKAISIRRESPESYVYLVSASWLYNGSLYRHNTRWLKSGPESELFQVAQALQVYTSQAKTDPEHAAEFEHIPPAEELLKKYPHNLELVAYFLNRTITEGDLDRVRELLQAVPVEIAEKDCRFWRAKAWCDDAEGHPELAESSLRKAYSLDPYWWQVHFQLYDLLRRQGRTEESAKFFAIYTKSKALSTEIMTLNRSVESLDSTKFCRSMLELAELVGDDAVATVLRERV